MIDAETIREQLKDILDETGCFLVELRVDKNNKIQVRLDRIEGIDIDVCALISRKLELKLDRNKEDFALEVSSPGLDSEFRVIEQYHKNLGNKVRVVTKDGKTAEGMLSKVYAEGIDIDIPETVSMNFNDIQSVRRIIHQ